LTGIRLNSYQVGFISGSPTDPVRKEIHVQILWALAPCAFGKCKRPERLLSSCAHQPRVALKSSTKVTVGIGIVNH